MIRGNKKTDSRRTLIVWLYLVIISGLAIQTIVVQAGQAQLTGEVTDANGAAIPATRVTLTETATNRSVETTADESGIYIFTNQKPGLYSVKFEASDFTPLIRNGVNLTTGERIRVDTRLEITTLDTTVTITADAPLLRSETSSLGQVIDNKKIVDLPLNGRNFLSLVGLAPGVAQPPRTTEGASLPRSNGGRPRTNEYLFDEISVLQPEPGQVAFFPVVDAIQEFKVEINNPPERSAIRLLKSQRQAAFVRDDWRQWRDSERRSRFGGFPRIIADRFDCGFSATRFFRQYEHRFFYRCHPNLRRGFIQSRQTFVQIRRRISRRKIKCFAAAFADRTIYF